jgi:Integrase core domain
VENTYIESFNGRLRDECLNVEMFVDLADAQLKIEKWRRDYSEQRPHGALAVRGARLSGLRGSAFSRSERVQRRNIERYRHCAFWGACSLLHGSCENLDRRARERW